MIYASYDLTVHHFFRLGRWMIIFCTLPYRAEIKKPYEGPVTGTVPLLNNHSLKKGEKL